MEQKKNPLVEALHLAINIFWKETFDTNENYIKTIKDRNIWTRKKVKLDTFLSSAYDKIEYIKKKIRSGGKKIKRKSYK